MGVPTETISVYDFKAHLSQVLSAVETTGTGVIVTRHGRPVAHVVPAPSSGIPRPTGMWHGKVTVPEGWDEFTDQDSADWYGE
ncbi:MAG: type II toxin-antitoxin system Phd/YefM family antitoxin [Bifidobacteriaceae bacterium]|nr:type II toxin-antitoxin system Phd/YefM family antitoxin [Bifidobacteriaceae bacterium]